MPSTLTIYSIFILVLGVSAIRKPATAIVALFILFSFEQWAQASDTYFFKNSWLTNYIVVAIIALGILSRSMRSQSIKPNLSQTFFLILLLFTYNFISMLWSSRADIALAKWETNITFLIFSIVVTPILLSQTKETKELFKLFILVATPLSLLLIFTVDWWGRYLVIKGTKSPFDPNPNAIGNLGVMLLISSLLYQPENKNKLLGFTDRAKIWASLKYIPFAIGLALAIKAESRGQLIAAGVSIAIAFWLKSKNNSILNLLKVLIVAAFIGVTFTVLHQIVIDDNARWTEDKISSDISLRTGAATFIIHKWSEDITTMIFGLGAGSTYSYLEVYTHVVPVEILTELGIIGLLIFTFIIIQTAKNIRLITGDYAINHGSTVALILPSLFIVEFVLYFKQGSLLVSPSIYVLALLIDRVASQIKARTNFKELKQVQPTNPAPKKQVQS